MRFIKFNCILLYFTRSKKQIQAWEEMVKDVCCLEKEPGYYSRFQKK